MGTVTPITVDNANFSGFYTIDMAIINGNPAIANSAHNFDIRFTSASDATGTAWNSTNVVVANVSTSVIRYVDLEMINGNPAIANYDSDDGDLYFVRATDASGTTWGTPVLVASTGNVGEYLSLKNINGRPAISYYDRTNQNLMYVRASDTGGNSWDAPVTVATTGNVGFHTSIEVVNGSPAIAYGDFTNTNLMYVRATNNTGTTWGTPVTVATHFGEEMNLMVVDGQPAIGYYTGFGDEDLRYVSVSYTHLTLPTICSV